MEHNFTDFNINTELGLDCEDSETVKEMLEGNDCPNETGEYSIA